jgi:hypothetical protein
MKRTSWPKTPKLELFMKAPNFYNPIFGAVGLGRLRKLPVGSGLGKPTGADPWGGAIEPFRATFGKCFYQIEAIMPNCRSKFRIFFFVQDLKSRVSCRL